ncbi:MAG: hypothetical protein CMC05_01570 [Flavobacteriaceae bacterium]|nr:hypothetical protein [Flavobacteriaceae bacterium]MBD10114.1 hypothetical protein [Flavobacteriaceae bacterium]|tara:strand:+ start:1517 stop:2260 length:744 start_codon:yes stop_codon:yes gene_type:complete
MIKFFRKIRYNLMSENKTGKYFKYAIGEIILVVIGILIALQINNWNESRKEQRLLQTYYKQILEDLDEQKKYSAETITQLDSSIASYEIYTQLFETKNLTVNEALDALNNVERITPYLNFRFNTMETLQSTGDIKIIPEDLRNKLITHKSKLDAWTTVNNGNLNVYVTGLLKYGEKGLGTFIPRLKSQPDIKQAIDNHINPIETILSAESAFIIKIYTEKNTCNRLKQVLENIKVMEDIIKQELREK